MKTTTALRPSYVGPDWLGHTTGFTFASPPPEQLASDAYLTSSNPWERIVCVVLQAQEGRFDNVEKLIDLATSTKDAEVGVAAVRVFCHAAPGTSLHLLERVFGHSDYDIRVESYTGAGLTCDPVVIPMLLPVLPLRKEDERGYIAMSVAELLDVAEDADDKLIETYEDIDAFTSRARDMMSVIASRLGPRTAIRFGEPLDVRRLVSLIREFCVREDNVDMGGVISDLLSIFEAMTGTPCVGCSTEDNAPIVPQIASVLNRFNMAGVASKFASGRRYFFGRAIPD
jgi:hypothetical protein